MQTAVTPIAPMDRPERRHEPERRCIASGQVRAREALIRFVVAPDGAIVPDVGGRLPGRGLWVTAERALLERACARNLFGKAAKANVRVPADLVDRVEAALAERALSLLGLARRAGQAVSGFERVRDWLRRGRAALLVEASDGAPGGQRKVTAAAPDVPVIALFTAAELGAALGVPQAVHVAVARGGLAERLAIEAQRLQGLRLAAVRAGSGIGKA